MNSPPSSNPQTLSLLSVWALSSCRVPCSCLWQVSKLNNTCWCVLREGGCYGCILQAFTPLNSLYLRSKMNQVFLLFSLSFITSPKLGNSICTCGFTSFFTFATTALFYPPFLGFLTSFDSHLSIRTKGHSAEPL